MTTTAHRAARAASALIALLSMASPATVAVAHSAVAAGAASTGAAEAPPSDALAATHARRFEAMVGRDLDALGELLADELTYAHSNGKVETKEEFLAALESGALQYLEIAAAGESTIRRYGDGTVGVITGPARVRVRIGEREGEVTLVYTSVYVHRDGRWQLVAWHSSAVPAG